VLLLVTAFTAAACARRAAADFSSPSRVAGSYVYAGRGSTFTVPWDFAAQLELDKDGTYVLTVDAVIKGDPDHDTDRGTFEVRGDSVWLRSHGGEGESHALAIRGDSLVAEFGWKGKLALRVAGVPDPVFTRSDR
jgi:hypothetical protein